MKNFLYVTKLTLCIFVIISEYGINVRGYFSALLVDSLLSSIVRGHAPRDNPVYRATPRYGRRGLKYRISTPVSPASPAGMSASSACPRRVAIFGFPYFHLPSFGCRKHTQRSSGPDLGNCQVSDWQNKVNRR